MPYDAPMTLDRISPDSIRLARNRAGLSQDDAARIAGLTRATIQNAETGRRSPSGRVLAALARVYGVSMDTFVGAASDPKEGVQE